MSDAPVQLEDITDPVLGESFDFSPEAEVESWRLTVPAKGACYVLLDGERQPVLLATCGDLRHALVRRLGPQDESQGPSKKIDYRAIVRHVMYRPVFSRFEAHWAYLENARRLWPKSYRKLIRHWRAHWININLADSYPRFDITEEPGGDPSCCFGPFIETAAARRYTDALEDLFDLCRYPHILAQAPHGQACAYKQMDRCPAPCDGSVPMEQYRGQLQQALAFITEPREPWIQAMAQRMKLAAAEQRFEDAARLKGMIDKAAAAGHAAGREIESLDRMCFLGLFKGEGKGTVRAFAITPGRIAYLGQSPRKQRDTWQRRLAEHATELCDQRVSPLDAPAMERVNLVAWHLLGNRRNESFIPCVQATEPARVAEAINDLLEGDGGAESFELEAASGNESSKRQKDGVT